MSKKFSHSVIFTKREIAVLRINISYKKASEGWKNKEPRKNKDINLKSVLVFREVGLFTPIAAGGSLYLSLTILVWGCFGSFF